MTSPATQILRGVAILQCFVAIIVAMTLVNESAALAAGIVAASVTSAAALFAFSQLVDDVSHIRAIGDLSPAGQKLTKLNSVSSAERYLSRDNPDSVESLDGQKWEPTSDNPNEAPDRFLG